MARSSWYEVNIKRRDGSGGKYLVYHHEHGIIRIFNNDMAGNFYPEGWTWEFNPIFQAFQDLGQGSEYRTGFSSMAKAKKDASEWLKVKVKEWKGV